MRKEFISRLLETVITFAEFIIASFLVLLAFFGLVYLAFHLFNAIDGRFSLSPSQIHAVLDIALVLFIVIELFRIAIAYITEQRVLGIVIEAAFVAVARKIVLYDFRDYSGIRGIYAAVSLAVLLSALALTYFAIKTRAHDR